jgi:hypothetical protein
MELLHNFVCVACFLTRCCSDGVHVQVLQMTMVVKLLYNFSHSIIYHVLLVVPNWQCPVFVMVTHTNKSVNARVV